MAATSTSLDNPTRPGKDSDTPNTEHPSAFRRKRTEQRKKGAKRGIFSSVGFSMSMLTNEEKCETPNSRYLREEKWGKEKQDKKADKEDVRACDVPCVGHHAVRSAQ